MATSYRRLTLGKHGTPPVVEMSDGSQKVTEQIAGERTSRSRIVVTL